MGNPLAPLIQKLQQINHWFSTQWEYINNKYRKNKGDNPDQAADVEAATHKHAKPNGEDKLTLTKNIGDNPNIYIYIYI